MADGNTKFGNVERPTSSDPTDRRVRGRNFGLAILAVVITVTFLSSIGLTKIRDTDDFWHLWCGRLIFETGTVPRTDPILFTTAGFDWVNLNWLAQILNYRMFLSFGLAGPMAFGGVLSATVLFCHLIMLRRLKVGLTAALASIAIALYAINFTHGTRPQDYSFALLALLNLLLRCSGDEKRIAASTAVLIAGILILWDNLHGGVIFGLMLIGCDIAGSLVAARREANNKGGRKVRPVDLITQRAAMLTAASSIGLLGYLAHPHGLDALLHTAFYTSSMNKALYQNVYELMPPSILGVQGALLTLYAVVFVALAYAVRCLSPLRDIFFFVLFLCLTQSMQRFLTPFLIVSLPLFTSNLDLYLRRHRSSDSSSTSAESADILFSMVASAVTTILALWLVVFMPNLSPSRRPGEDEARFVNPEWIPAGAAGFIRESKIAGRIFNEYNTGGYLGWILYPEQRVYIDGRGDLISGGPIFENFLKIKRLERGYLSLLRDLQIEVALLSTGSKLAQALEHGSSDTDGLATPPWKVLFRDSWYTVLKRPDGFGH